MEEFTESSSTPRDQKEEPESKGENCASETTTCQDDSQIVQESVSSQTCVTSPTAELPKTAKSPEALKASQTTEASETAETPQTAEAPQTAGAPQMAEALETAEPPKETAPNPQNAEVEKINFVELNQVKDVEIKATSKTAIKKGAKKKSIPPQKTQKVVAVSRRSSSSSSIQDVVQEMKALNKEEVISSIDLCSSPGKGEFCTNSTLFIG